MIKRPRQIDYLRTLTRINAWEEFNSFDNEGQGSTIGNGNSQAIGEEKYEKEEKKQEIPIIAISNIKVGGNTSQGVVDELYKKRKMQQSNYIRIRHDQVWPLQEKYELGDDDVIFLKDFNEEHGFSMKQEELESIIESLELKSGKDFIITWIDMKDYIPAEQRDKYTFANLEKIYNYWRLKRDSAKRPLLRLHWKPNFNDKDPHVAFRPRVAEKMKLRRQMKQNDEEQYIKLSALREEMNKYKLLVEQIRLREQMKETLKEIQNLSFVSELYKVDKQMSYFFVDEWFDSQKDFENKRSQIDERISVLHKQSNVLQTELAKYVSQPEVVLKSTTRHESSIPPTNTVGSNKRLFRPTGIPKGEGNTIIITNAGVSANAASLPNGISIAVANPPSVKWEDKKNKSLRVPLTETPAPLEIENDPEKARKLQNQEKKDKKLQQKLLHKQQKSGGIDKLLEIPSSSLAIKKDELLKTDKETDLKNLKLSAIASSGILTHSSQLKKGEKHAPTEDLSLKAGDNMNILNSSEANKSDHPNSTGSISGQNIFTTCNLELASFIASMFIEGSRQELSLEKVCGFDSKQLDRDHFQLILANHKGELSQALKARLSSGRQALMQSNMLLTNNVNNTSASAVAAGVQKQQGAAKMNPLMGEYYNPSNPNNTLSGGSGSQMNGIYYDSNGRQQIGQNLSREMSSYANTHLNQSDNANQRKKNVILFKTRLRLGRSGIYQIDRQFDDMDNLRYEDICSKEANYRPSKIVDKLLVQELEKERKEQMKLKVFSYTPSDLDLFKKDYFQQMQMKYKSLVADENEDTLPLYPISSCTSLQNKTINTNASSFSEEIPAILNADLENKYLKRIISQGVKDYQKKKSLSQYPTTTTTQSFTPSLFTSSK